MIDLFSQFADQFKPKEGPQKDVKSEPIQSYVPTKEDRLVDRYEAYRKSNPEYISVKDFQMLEQREETVESLETMSEFEKKQRRLADKSKGIVSQTLEHLIAHDKLNPNLASHEPMSISMASIIQREEEQKSQQLKPSRYTKTINENGDTVWELKELQQLNGIHVQPEYLKEQQSISVPFPHLIEEMFEISKHYNSHIIEERSKLYVGVDPGKKGGIVAINDKVLLGKWTMPLLGDDIDAQGIWDILADLKYKYEITLVLEDVHSLFGMSAATNFSMGHTLGIILGIIVTSKIKLIRVAPKTWQKEIWNASDMEYKPMIEGKKKASVDTKLTSMKAAHRLFPNADFRATTRSKNDHDGITDAVCLAEYARIKNL